MDELQPIACKWGMRCTNDDCLYWHSAFEIPDKATLYLHALKTQEVNGDEFTDPLECEEPDLNDSELATVVVSDDEEDIEAIITEMDQEYESEAIDTVDRSVNMRAIDTIDEAFTLHDISEEKTMDELENANNALANANGELMFINNELYDQLMHAYSVINSYQSYSIPSHYQAVSSE
jgi:hypothetical protein